MQYIAEYVIATVLLYLYDSAGNFEPMRDEEGEGPGERGAAHHTSRSQERQVQETVNDYGMNIVASNEISLDRSIPDTRLQECKYWHYPTDLPKVRIYQKFSMN